MEPHNGADSDPEFIKPLQHKRPFGAGIKRKRIEFVPQSTVASESQIRSPKPPAGDRYLSIVMPSRRVTDHDRSDHRDLDKDANLAPARSRATSEPPSTTTPHSSSENTISTPSPSLCPICHLPTTPSTTSQHASTLAHQVCLPHTHPPSHLDRHRKGLAFLSSYGWDPDARLGLGAQGDGRLYPVQPRQREGRVGVGGDERVEGSGQGLRAKRRVKEVVKRGNETRKERETREREEVKRRERMRMLVLGRDDVNSMLGVQL